MSATPASPFTGKTVVITGAASGFGQASAQQFAAAGARIIGIDIDAARLSAAMTALPPPPAGRRPHRSLVCDLRPAEAAARVIADAAGDGDPLDILVNSAGVCHFNTTGGITPAEWDEVLEIDLRALFFLSVAFAERIDPARGGRIVNLGSNAGRKGRALSAHYAAAKAGVASLTESLALAYGSRNVTANTVCPAVVLTPLWEQSFRELTAITGKMPADLVAGWTNATPLKRLGTPEDVANLIVFLASDRAAFITGQTINVCGGFQFTC
ncbi:MAG TPA: SDR family NAD(P)-dependent oxidoreductase [Opitutaceae bacterium]|nr:SDR family NAD(P)-dependent oxidoreductase [Opitutaceae bacterium]